MQVTAILALLALLLPVVAGVLLARARPQLGAPFAALLASLPLLLAFALLALSLQSGGEKAPFGLAAVLVFGTIALLCGFGLGMVGHMLGLRSARK